MVNIVGGEAASANSVLRALVDEAGLSNAALSRSLQAGSPHLRELDERIMSFLGRSSAQRDEGFIS